MERVNTVVIGAGQAGLVMSHFLQNQGRKHVLLERARIGERWRSERWDSLRFQFPNRYVRLPGMPYDGDDPDGFMPKDEVVQRIQRYAAQIKAPVRTGVEVCLVETGGVDRFLVHSTSGVVATQNVVCAVGPYQRPFVPEISAGLPPSVVQVTANRYSNADQFPPGAVLVVGTGASGAQIAEDLIDSGRQVYVSAGNHGRIPRRYRGRDVTDWLDAIGPRFEQPRPVMLTSVRGGYDMDLRALAHKGAVLAGRLQGVSGARLHFSDDLAARVAEADAAFDGACDRIDSFIASRPDLASAARPAGPRPKHGPLPHGLTDLDLYETGIVAVIWATGYRHDLGWLPSEVLDKRGDPIHERGVTKLAGLYFLGLLYQYSNRSTLFWGVTDDAEYVAGKMVAEAAV
jgi:putative flavoprotein involved in K+ transport